MSAGATPSLSVRSLKLTTAEEGPSVGGHQHGRCFAVPAAGPDLVEAFIHFLTFCRPGMHALAHLGEVRRITQRSRFTHIGSVGFENRVQNSCGVGVETVFIGPVIPVHDEFHQIRHGFALVHSTAPAPDGTKLWHILLCMRWAHYHHDEQS